MTDEDFWRLLHSGRSILTDPASWLGIVIAAIGNALAWAQSIDVGAVATAITLITTAVVGAVVMAYGQISKARINSLRDYELTFRDSLQAKVDRVTIDLKEEIEAHEQTRRELSHVIEDRNVVRQELGEARRDREIMRAEFQAKFDAQREEYHEVREKFHALSNRMVPVVNDAAIAKMAAEKLEAKVDATRAELRAKGAIDPDSDPDLAQQGQDTHSGDTGEFPAAGGG